MQHVRVPWFTAIRSYVLNPSAGYRIRTLRDALRPGALRATGSAALAAALLGAGVPAAHALLAQVPPLLLAALLGLGGAAAMTVVEALRQRARRLSRRARLGSVLATGSSGVRWSASSQQASDGSVVRTAPRSGLDWARLGAAVLAGGVFAPVCLLGGLAVSSASAACLLLELEAVFLAGAWWLLAGRRPPDAEFAGLLAVLGGALVLAWPTAGDTLISSHVSTRFLALGLLPGAQLIALACLGFALERVLLAGLATPGDPVYLRWKGLLAGTLDVLLAFAVHCPLPDASATALTVMLGAVWFGLAPWLAHRAGRALTPAQAGAWQALVPLLGVAIALLVFRDLRPHGLLAAVALLGIHLLVRVRAARPQPAIELPAAPLHAGAAGPQPSRAVPAAQPGASAVRAPEDSTDEVRESDSEVAPTLREAYRQTDYRIRSDPPLTLRIGAPNEPFARLMADHGAHAAAIVTAWNPRGCTLDPAQNAARLDVLRRELTAAGHLVLEGIGEGQDAGIPGEDSLIALGMPRAAAVDCGRRHDQNAIVWVGADACPQLVMLR